MVTTRHLTRVRSWSVACVLMVCCHLVSVAMVWSDPCKPAADEIALYTESAFGGSCVVKGIGEYPVINFPGQDVRRVQLPSFASIKLGERLEVLACSDPKLTGICIVVSKSLKTFANQKISSAMSVVVRAADRPPVCVPDANKVAVWDHQHFFGHCQVFNLGAYPYSIQPLRAGSLQVGSEARAKVCASSIFESPCRDFRSGSYDSWSYEDGGRQVRGIEVRPASGFPCDPGSLQVSLYEFANFVGRCRRFSEGEYTPQETWGWAGNQLRSISVGSDVLGCTLCWQNDQRRNSCINAHTTAEGLPEFSLDHPPSLKLWLNREEPRDEEPQDQQPEPEDEHSRTVWLAGHSPFVGFPWWDGRFPSIGGSDGILTRVANPRNSVWLGFLKSGHGSDDCGDRDAYVLLQPGDTMTDNQMREAFGAASPELPINFVACSGAVAQAGARGELIFPALPLNISFTEPR